jgi:hypothetical protein
MRNYDDAEALLGILSFVTWVGMAITVGAGVYLGYATENLVLLLSLVALAILGGVTILAAVQVGYAILHTSMDLRVVAHWAHIQLRREHQRRQSANGGSAPFPDASVGPAKSEPSWGMRLLTDGDTLTATGRDSAREPGH